MFGEDPGARGPCPCRSVASAGSPSVKFRLAGITAGEVDVLHVQAGVEHGGGEPTAIDLELVPCQNGFDNIRDLDHAELELGRVELGRGRDGSDFFGIGRVGVASRR